MMKLAFAALTLRNLAHELLRPATTPFGCCSARTRTALVRLAGRGNAGRGAAGLMDSSGSVLLHARLKLLLHARLRAAIECSGR